MRRRSRQSPALPAEIAEVIAVAAEIALAQRQRAA